MIAALLAAFVAPAIHASAIEVGRISLSVDGAKTLVKVATKGKVDVKVSGDGAAVVAFVPGGERDLKPLDLSTGKSMVKGISFAKEEGGLKIKFSLRQEAEASLESNGPEGFMVALAPGGKKGAKDSAAQADLGSKVAGYTYRIVDLSLEGDAQKSELIISADGPASYRHSVRDNGKTLRLVFTNSALAWTGDGSLLRDEAIERVKVSQVNSGGDAQVQIDLKLWKKADYSFLRDQNQLLVRLDKPMVEKEVSKKGNIDALVSLDVQNADLVGVVKVLCEQAGFEYQFTKDILSKTGDDNLVTFRAENRPFKEVMEGILEGAEARMLRQGNTLYIGGTAEVATKLGRLPTITRTYTPRVLTITQLLAVVGLHYNFDDTAKDRFVKGAVKDPRDPNRVMLTGTESEVQEWRGLFTRYDVSEGGASSAGEGGIETRVFKFQYLEDASLVNAAITQVWPTDAPPTQFDAKSRSLVVTSNSSNLAKIARIVRRLDARVPQVNIEAKIVEVNQNVNASFGINWSQVNNTTNPTTNLQVSPGGGSSSTVSLALGFLQSGVNINAIIQAAVQEDKADVISSPNITVKDNESASINITDSISFPAPPETVISQGVPILVPKSQQQTFPLVLQVKPLIASEAGKIMMDISFNLVTQTGPQIGTQAAPTSSQQASTRVGITNAETAVIGGLVRQVATVTENKVPILGDIPLLGMLFKFKGENKQKKEVMIFITPTIVED